MSSTPVESVPDYTTIVGLRRTNIADLVSAQVEIDAKIKHLKEQKSTLNNAAVKLLIKAEVKTVMVAGLRCTRVEGMSSRLDKKKLFKLGGEKVMRWIEQATVKTPRSPYVLITKPEEKGDSAEDEE